MSQLHSVERLEARAYFSVGAQMIGPILNVWVDPEITGFRPEEIHIDSQFSNFEVQEVVVYEFGAPVFFVARESVSRILVRGGPHDDLITVEPTLNIPSDLAGNHGNDVLSGGAADDLLLGGDGNDRLFGFDGGDELRGERGDDYMDGGFGADRFSGGDSSSPHVASFFGHGDTVSYASRTDPSRPVTANMDGLDNDGYAGERDRIPDDVERIVGGAGNDRLSVGQATGSRALEGNGGDDFLTAGRNTHYVIVIGEVQVPDVNFGRPHDHFTGVAGNDTIIGVGSQGSGAIRVLGDFATHGRDDYPFGGGPAVPAAGGNDNISIFARGPVYVGAGRGNDRVTVLLRLVTSATIVGDEGDDDVRVTGSGSCLVFGGSGDDSLGVRGLVRGALRGGDGNDRIEGGSRDDNLQGGNGNDVIIGGRGLDEMYGDAGNDLIVARDGIWFEIVDGGSGTDTATVDRDFFSFIRDSINNIETIL